MTSTNRAVALRTAVQADTCWIRASRVGTWAPLAGSGQKAAK